MRKVSWKDLYIDEQLNYGDGCGIHPFLSVPNLIWCEECRHHDFRWSRGTGWAWSQHWFLPYSVVRWYGQGVVSKLWSNLLFFYHMEKKAFQQWNKPMEMLIYVVLGAVYFLGVFPGAFVPLKFGSYLSKNAILYNDFRKKEKLNTL